MLFKEGVMDSTKLIFLYTIIGRALLQKKYPLGGEGPRFLSPPLFFSINKARFISSVNY